MKKKIVASIFLLGTFILTLNSCRTDDITDQAEQAQKEKIAFFENFEKNLALSKSSEINYAYPFAQCIEYYLENNPKTQEFFSTKYGYLDKMVSSQSIDGDEGEKLIFFPILGESRKVTGILAGVVNGKRDYLYYDVWMNENPDVLFIISRFQEYYDHLNQGRSDTTEIDPIVITVTRPIKLSSYDLWTDGPGNGNGGQNGGHLASGGNSGFGGGTNNPPATNTDPCAKMKAQNINPDFKAKVASLDKKEVFDKNQETGFSVAYGPQTSYAPLSNTANDNLQMPDGDKYFGYIHTHLDSKDGVVKIFSPADVSTFLTRCVRNAQLKGTMTDAYGMVITSQGNYILKYFGDGNYGIGPVQETAWQTWYETEFAKIANEDGSILQNNVEKLFTQFLKEAVKVAGLEVYKSDKTNGNTTKLEYNGKDQPVKTTPCP